MGIVKKSYVNHGVLTEKCYKEGVLVGEYTSEYPKDLVQVSDYMPDGTRIQIESWNDSYVIGAYPVAKMSNYTNAMGAVYPEKGKSFRCQYNFSSLEEAEKYFGLLKSGSIALSDIVDKYRGFISNINDYVN